MKANRNKLKQTNFFVTVFLFIIFATNFLAAQERRLTLEDAIKIALENNRDTKIARMEVQKAGAAVDEAFGYALPTVNFSANFMHYMQKPIVFFPDFNAMLGNKVYQIIFDEGLRDRDDSKFVDPGLSKMSFSLDNSYETKIEASQILFNSAVFQGIGASKIYLDLSKESLKGTVANTILSVKQAFYGVLLTKEMLNILEASLANAEDNLKNVKAMQSQGLVSDFDAMQVEVRVENIKPSVLQLRNSLKNAKSGLKIILGLEQDDNIDVEGELKYKDEEIPDEPSVIKEALGSNFDINTLKIKKDVDNAFIQLDVSDYWPSVAAFANYSYAGQSNTLDFMNYSSSIVGLSFSINLFRGMQTSNKVQQSQIALKQTEEQLSMVKDAIVSQVKSKLLDLSRVKAQLESQERNVELAKRAYDLSLVRYKEGTGNQLEIQNSDLALQQAKTNKLQSVYEYIVAKAELDKLLGKVEPEYLK